MAEGLVWLEDLLKLLSFGLFKTFARLEVLYQLELNKTSSPGYILITRLA